MRADASANSAGIDRHGVGWLSVFYNVEKVMHRGNLYNVSNSPSCIGALTSSNGKTALTVVVTGNMMWVCNSETPIAL